jgi:hypothetical protein
MGSFGQVAFLRALKYNRDTLAFMKETWWSDTDIRKSCEDSVSVSVSGRGAELPFTYLKFLALELIHDVICVDEGCVVDIFLHLGHSQQNSKMLCRLICFLTPFLPDAHGSGAFHPGLRLI